VTVGAPSTQWWIALSSAIVFGLAFSTMLTLVVTPSALMLFTRDNAWNADERSLLAKMFRRKPKGAAQDTEAGEAAPASGPAQSEPAEPFEEFPKAAE
jgi:multidrug efflux pump